MSTRVTVVVAHHSENLDWVSRVDGYDVKVVSKTNHEAFIYQPLNKGFEASAYLDYIVRCYEDLSDFTVFVHGHERSWHHEGSMDALINSLDLKATYMNINSPHLRFWQPKPDDIARHNDILQEHGIGPYRAPKLRPCAMFYVHKDLIRRRGKDVYQSLLDLLLRVDGSKGMATVFEYCWFKLFTDMDDEDAWEQSES